MVTGVSDRFDGLASSGEPGFCSRESSGSDVYRSSNNARPAIPGVNDQPPKLLDRLQEALRARHYSPRTKSSRTGEEGRNHIHETLLQGAIKEAVSKAGIVKRVGCHNFRHSFATHLVEDRYDIRISQELPEHKDVSTTMIYTHVLKKAGQGVRSPFDAL
jgi:integrase